MNGKEKMALGSAAGARTFLFAPSHRPDRFEKAARSGADAVILDLEDSVPIEQRGAARAALSRGWSMLQSLHVPLLVRMNALQTSDAEADLGLLASLELPFAVIVPKAESGDCLTQVHERLAGMALLPIIESAKGWAALPSIAMARGVLRLVAGYVDFMADTGMQCDPVETELASLKFAICMATRINELASAVDGVTLELDDNDKLVGDVRRAMRFGFGAKLCVHPRQVAIVHQAMRPTSDELQWARKVIAADASAAGGAVQVDGRMVDIPVVIQARRTLARIAPGDETV
jgi:citrate lyase subunit beta / citryl-CoA lyase